MKRYYSLNDYLKETFGEKVYKLALDGGMTCPNRDGTKGNRGCIFCSAGGSGDFSEKYTGNVGEQIEKAKCRISAKTKAQKFIAYFQSYTNTYAETSYLKKLFYSAIENESVVALSIGTRPDCLPDEIIKLLSDLNKIKPVFVELGLQTMHEDTAGFIRRGYDLATFNNAVERLKKENINVVVHMIIGLPFETREMMLQTARFIADSGADGIKLQLLHILKGTDLENLYNDKVFSALSLAEYIEILCEILPALPPKMVIHRLTGDAPKAILTAPQWSADKKKVLNAINNAFDEHNIIQGSAYIKNKK